MAKSIAQALQQHNYNQLQASFGQRRVSGQYNRD